MEKIITSLDIKFEHTDTTVEETEDFEAINCEQHSNLLKKYE